MAQPVDFVRLIGWNSKANKASRLMFYHKNIYFSRFSENFRISENRKFSLTKFPRKISEFPNSEILKSSKKGMPEADLLRKSLEFESLSEKI